jgi:polysaccharide deacetylase 2 family uncharacterized protein YibQ
MAGREGTPQRTSFRTIVLLTLLPVAGVLAFLTWMAVRSHVPARSQVSVLSSQLPVPSARKATPANRELRTENRELRTPAVAIIIDDVGYDGQPIDRAMAIESNFTFAVLPNSTRGTKVAEILHDRGFEVLCHLPMEPRGGSVSPGPNAILTSMSDSEIAGLTRENLAAVPYARGVNNHMGSLATTDRRVMTAVIRTLPKGLYFIDSRTDGRSIAAKVAREMNVKTATRQVFLDDAQDEASVRRQLSLLIATARTKGVAIGIGHPHDVTLRVLASEVPELRKKGFRFVRASEVVN